jgi:hypothetical protein
VDPNAMVMGGEEAKTPASKDRRRHQRKKHDSMTDGESCRCYVVGYSEYLLKKARAPSLFTCSY